MPVGFARHRPKRHSSKRATESSVRNFHKLDGRSRWCRVEHVRVREKKSEMVDSGRRWERHVRDFEAERSGSLSR